MGRKMCSFVRLFDIQYNISGYSHVVVLNKSSPEDLKILDSIFGLVVNEIE